MSFQFLRHAVTPKFKVHNIWVDVICHDCRVAEKSFIISILFTHRVERIELESPETVNEVSVGAWHQINVSNAAAA